MRGAKDEQKEQFVINSNSTRGNNQPNKQNTCSRRPQKCWKTNTL